MPSQSYSGPNKQVVVSRGVPASPAAELQPPVMAVGAPISNVGSVSTLPGYQGMLPPLDSFSVTLANASSVAFTYIIGDPTGGLENAIGGTLNDPTSCSWNGAGGVTPMKLSFGYAPVAIRGFNYQTSSNASQFFQTFQVVTADIKNNIIRNPLPIAQAQRNTQFNDLLLTIDLARPVILNWQNALVVTVLAGETVNIEFYPYMAANRV